nr:unnamed protein product [Digitaria exilis]
MATEEDVKQRQIIESRARNISHNVRCTECGKSDKEIYKKLEDEYGETVLYAPKFDLQTAGIWLSPVIVGGVAAGIWALPKA